jgi:hypothetical protein
MWNQLTELTNKKAGTEAHIKRIFQDIGILRAQDEDWKAGVLNMIQNLGDLGDKNSLQSEINTRT